MHVWRDHSLTIVLVTCGVMLTAFAFMFDEGRVFDLWLGLGVGTLTVALFYFLSAAGLRETTKPED